MTEIIREIYVIERKSVPNYNENITTDFPDFFTDKDIISIIKKSPAIKIYYKTLKNCMDEKSYWICDIYHDDNDILRLLLPKETPKEEVITYFEPLITFFKKIQSGKIGEYFAKDMIKYH